MKLKPVYFAPFIGLWVLKKETSVKPNYPWLVFIFSVGIISGGLIKALEILQLPELAMTLWLVVPVILVGSHLGSSYLEATQRAKGGKLSSWLWTKTTYEDGLREFLVINYHELIVNITGMIIGWFFFGNIALAVVTKLLQL